MRLNVNAFAPNRAQVDPVSGGSWMTKLHTGFEILEGQGFIGSVKGSLKEYAPESTLLRGSKGPSLKDLGVLEDLCANSTSLRPICAK
jgi:hypothetical protein